MMSESVRADKWLWATRFFKTRGLAAEACAAGKVKRSGREVKASSTIQPGDLLAIPFPEGPGFRTVTVMAVIEKRVGAPEARTCYSELTTPDIFEAQQGWHQARSEGMRGRPTKKNRRDMDLIHRFGE